MLPFKNRSINIFKVHSRIQEGPMLNPSALRRETWKFSPKFPPFIIATFLRLTDKRFGHSMAIG